MDEDNYTPEGFMAQLGEKGALRDCPCCGQNNWRTPEDGLVRVPGNVSEQGIDFRVPMHMNCAPLICGNCDFVRFHVLSLLMGK